MNVDEWRERERRKRILSTADKLTILWDMRKYGVKVVKGKCSVCQENAVRLWSANRKSGCMAAVCLACRKVNGIIECSNPMCLKKKLATCVFENKPRCTRCNTIARTEGREIPSRKGKPESEQMIRPKDSPEPTPEARPQEEMMCGYNELQFIT